MNPVTLRLGERNLRRSESLHRRVDHPNALRDDLCPAERIRRTTGAEVNVDTDLRHRRITWFWFLHPANALNELTELIGAVGLSADGDF